MSGEYETRYCAFVDILGFQSFIKILDQRPSHFWALRRLLRTLHEPDTWDSDRYPLSDFRSQSISDGIAISTKHNPDGLRHIFTSIRNLAIDVLLEGYFVRGAIVKGQLYHDEKMVFGEALIRAFLLERDIVRYPRIMIVQDVVNDSDDLWEQRYDSPLLDVNVPQNPFYRVGDDGPSHLHVLQALEKDVLDEGAVSQHSRIYSVVVHQFRNSRDDPRLFEKLQWFARYWNTTLPRENSLFERIKGPGVD